MSNFDPWNINQVVQTYWVQLKAQGSWINQATSNKFNVTFKPAFPPSVTNTFEVQVYLGHNTEVELPAYLFKSSTSSQLNYQSSSWVGINSIDVITQIRNSTSSSGKSLFVKAFTGEGWQVSITATDASCQTAEILVTIKVLRWASKAWVECDGPYESNWLKCADNLVLDSDSRMWLATATFSVFSVSSVYKICGLICFIVILIHSVLWVRYGYSMLELAVHSQSLMLMVVSSDNISSRWIEYLSWLKYFKFDFSFINDIFRVMPIMCTESTGKLFVLGFEWEETLLNYQYLILLLIIIFIWKVIIINFKLFKSIFSNSLDRNLRYLQLYQYRYSLIWPFIFVNLIFEFYSFKQHIFLSWVSTILLALAILFTIKNRFFFLQLKFIQTFDKNVSISYFYLKIANKALILLLFIPQSKQFLVLIMVLILITQTSILFAQVNHKVVNLKSNIFWKAAGMFGNAVMLIITILITCKKVNHSKGSIILTVTLDNTAISVILNIKSEFKPRRRNMLSVSFADDNNVSMLLTHYNSGSNFRILLIPSYNYFQQVLSSLWFQYQISTFC